MSQVIVDRVAVHGENGSVLITRDRNGWYYLEARSRSGGKTVVQLHKDTVRSEDGLVDQMQRFTGIAGVNAPALEPANPGPRPPSFRDLLMDTMEEQGLSGIDLAHALRMRSLGSVTSWLSGKNLPRRKHLAPLAAALDLDLDTLIEAYGRAVVEQTRKAA